jgi:hypothetical protein
MDIRYPDNDYKKIFGESAWIVSWIVDIRKKKGEESEKLPTQKEILAYLDSKKVDMMKADKKEIEAFFSNPLMMRAVKEYLTDLAYAKDLFDREGGHLLEAEHFRRDLYKAIGLSIE